MENGTSSDLDGGNTLEEQLLRLEDNYNNSMSQKGSNNNSQHHSSNSKIGSANNLINISGEITSDIKKPKDNEVVEIVTQHSTPRNQINISQNQKKKTPSPNDSIHGNQIVSPFRFASNSSNSYPENIAESPDKLNKKEIKATPINANAANSIQVSRKQSKITEPKESRKISENALKPPNIVRPLSPFTPSIPGISETFRKGLEKQRTFTHPRDTVREFVLEENFLGQNSLKQVTPSYLIQQETAVDDDANKPWRDSILNFGAQDDEAKQRNDQARSPLGVRRYRKSALLSEIVPTKKRISSVMKVNPIGALLQVENQVEFQQQTKRNQQLVFNPISSKLEKAEMPNFKIACKQLDQIEFDKRGGPEANSLTYRVDLSVDARLKLRACVNEDAKQYKLKEKNQLPGITNPPPQKEKTSNFSSNNNGPQEMQRLQLFKTSLKFTEYAESIVQERYLKEKENLSSRQFDNPETQLLSSQHNQTYYEQKLAQLLNTSQNQKNPSDVKGKEDSKLVENAGEAAEEFIAEELKRAKRNIFNTKEIRNVSDSLSPLIAEPDDVSALTTSRKRQKRPIFQPFQRIVSVQEINTLTQQTKAVVINNNNNNNISNNNKLIVSQISTSRSQNTPRTPTAVFPNPSSSTLIPSFSDIPAQPSIQNPSSRISQPQSQQLQQNQQQSQSQLEQPSETIKKSIKLHKISMESTSFQEDQQQQQQQQQQQKPFIPSIVIHSSPEQPLVNALNEKQHNSQLLFAQPANFTTFSKM